MQNEVNNETGASTTGETPVVETSKQDQPAAAQAPVKAEEATAEVTTSQPTASENPAEEAPAQDAVTSSPPPPTTLGSEGINHGASQNPLRQLKRKRAARSISERYSNSSNRNKPSITREILSKDASSEFPSVACWSISDTSPKV
jgi:hypothetical protein